MEALQDTRRGREVRSLAEMLREDPEAQKYFVPELKKLFEDMMIMAAKKSKLSR